MKFTFFHDRIYYHLLAFTMLVITTLSCYIYTVGAAVAVVGIAAYRLYCARRHASN
jgi:hypothetical protein